MNYETFRRNKAKEYLGYCDDLKSYIYSVEIDLNGYAVVALKNGKVTVLITCEVQPNPKK